MFWRLDGVTLRFFASLLGLSLLHLHLLASVGLAHNLCKDAYRSTFCSCLCRPTLLYVAHLDLGTGKQAFYTVLGIDCRGKSSMSLYVPALTTIPVCCRVVYCSILQWDCRKSFRSKWLRLLTWILVGSDTRCGKGFSVGHRSHRKYTFSLDNSSDCKIIRCGLQEVWHATLLSQSLWCFR